MTIIRPGIRLCLPVLIAGLIACGEGETEKITVGEYRQDIATAYCQKRVACVDVGTTVEACLETAQIDIDGDDADVLGSSSETLYHNCIDCFGAIFCDIQAESAINACVDDCFAVPPENMGVSPAYPN